MRLKLALSFLVIPSIALAIHHHLATTIFKVDKFDFVADASTSLTYSFAGQAHAELQQMIASCKPFIYGFLPRKRKFDSYVKKVFSQNPEIHIFTMFSLQNQSEGTTFKNIALLEQVPGSEIWKDVQNRPDFQDLLKATQNHGIALRTWKTKNHSWIALGFVNEPIGEDESKRNLSLAVFKDHRFLESMLKSEVYSSAIWDSAGNLIFSAQPQNASLAVDPSAIRELIQSKAPTGITKARGADKDTLILSFSRLGLGDYLVTTTTSQKTAYEAMSILNKKTGLIGIFMLSVSLLFGVILSRRIPAQSSRTIPLNGVAFTVDQSSKRNRNSKTLSESEEILPTVTDINPTALEFTDKNPQA